ncbi:MAG: hypothetical protein B6D55_04800 [Candidatus Omnitrophica bacterium 4484_70.2]|nr:MAG: hypothetical protein B6D55_04800 [Candidatus Omnitrophica bacterium 4484_70.2]
MRWFLDKSFWEEKFTVEKEALDFISLLIEREGRVCTARELAEEVVKLFLKKGEWISEEYKDSKVFSCNAVYREGDKIIVFKKIKGGSKVEPIFGIVKQVENHKNFPFSTHDGRKEFLKKCDIIKVVFPDGEWREYVCNSPSYIGIKQNYLTPKEIVDKFENTILNKVDSALSSDERFSKTEKKKWALTPPREIVNTLTDEQVSCGFIKITSGLNAMLVFYKYTNEVPFTTYGGYIINGFIDWENKRIYGDEIKEWYKENNLIQGDRIHIVAPEKKDKYLTIYTTLERKQIDISKTSDKNQKERVHLRHKIYRLFRGEGKFLHIKEIQNQLVSRLKKEIHLETIYYILYSNSHLFVRIKPKINIWGLLAWRETDKKNSVDVVSLLLAIKEDDLVYKILEYRGIFMTIKEIAKEISEYFHINKKEIIESMFVDFNDSRFLRDKHGRLGLRVWVEEWDRNLKFIRDSLKRIEELEIGRDTKEKSLKLIMKEIADLIREKEVKRRELLEIKNKEQTLSDEINNLERQLEEIAPPFSSYKRNIYKIKIEKIEVFLGYIAVGLYISIYPDKSIGGIISAFLILLLLSRFMWSLFKRGFSLTSEFYKLRKEKFQICEKIEERKLSREKLLEKIHKINRDIENLENNIKNKIENRLILENTLQKINSGLTSFNKPNLFNEKVKYEKFLNDIVNLKEGSLDGESG